jgi:hypothetical protein
MVQKSMKRSLSITENGPGHSQKHIGKICIFLLLVFCVIFYGTAKEDPYSLLKQVPTYHDLITCTAIKQYSVPVTASGKIWDEITCFLEQQGTTEYELIEYFRAPDLNALRLETKNGSATHLIAGLMDPLKIFQILLQELESFKSVKVFNELKELSSATLSDSGNAWAIELKPKSGNSILRQYSDYGTEGVFTEIAWLKATIEKKTHVIRSLELEKNIRIQAMQNDLKEYRNSIVRYEFDYFFSKTAILPSEMLVWRNNIPVIALSTTYQLFQSVPLPLKKVFSYTINGTTEQLSFTYGTFNLNAKIPQEVFIENKTTGPFHLQEANRLSKEAQEALMSGKMVIARRKMKTLIFKYPESPQAKQAQIFLQGLPE